MVRDATVVADVMKAPLMAMSKRLPRIIQVSILAWRIPKRLCAKAIAHGVKNAKSTTRNISPEKMVRRTCCNVSPGLRFTSKYGVSACNATCENAGRVNKARVNKTLRDLSSVRRFVCRETWSGKTTVASFVWGDAVDSVSSGCPESSRIVDSSTYFRATKQPQRKTSDIDNPR